jgi:hypothetical protein
MIVARYSSHPPIMLILLVPVPVPVSFAVTDTA